MGGYKRIMYKMYKFLTDGEGGAEKMCRYLYGPFLSGSPKIDYYMII